MCKKWFAKVQNSFGLASNLFIKILSIDDLEFFRLNAT